MKRSMMLVEKFELNPKEDQSGQRFNLQYRRISGLWHDTAD